MGAGSSAAAGNAEPPKRTSSQRKFQSYHLPFVRKQKGFAKLSRTLSRRLFGSRKEPKSGTYERTLALLSSGCEPTPNSVQTDPTAPIVYESRASTEDLANFRGLDYQLYYRACGNGFLLTRSPPSHFSLVDGGLQTIGYDDEYDDTESVCDAVSLPDDKLIRRRHVVHDAYSEVIRRSAATKKLAKVARSASSSPRNVKNGSSKSSIAGSSSRSPKIGKDVATKQRSLSPRTARTPLLGQKGSPSILKRGSSVKELVSSTENDSSLKVEPDTPRVVGLIEKVPAVMGNNAGALDVEVTTMNSSVKSAEPSILETAPNPETKSTMVEQTPSDECEAVTSPVAVQTLVTQSETLTVDEAVPPEATTAAVAAGDVIPAAVPDITRLILDSTDYEGDLLLKDIAEKEQRLKEKLSQVQSMLVNSVKAGGRNIASDSSCERSGSVDDDEDDAAATDRAVGGSQSSDAVASIEEEMDVPDTAPSLQNVAVDDVVAAAIKLPFGSYEQMKSVASAENSKMQSGVRVQLKSSESLNILSEVGAKVRQSSPSSSSADGRMSSPDCNVALVASSQSPRDICLKLVKDLTTNLEVNLDDFHEFLTLDARLEHKYEVLPIEKLLWKNLYLGVTLDEISRCFRILAKYGLNLLKPESERPKYWNKIIAMTNSQPSCQWLSIHGSKDILIELGYREVGSSLLYAVAHQPKRSVTAWWVIELLLAAYELNAHSLGSHPKPEVFGLHDRAEGGGSGYVGWSGDEWTAQQDSMILPEPVYENCTSAPLDCHSDGGAEPREMFGRRTIVPWLSDKENRQCKETPATAAVAAAAATTTNMIASVQCGVCGSSSPAVRCEKCCNQIFCLSCDDMYHRHPKRRDHVRKVVHAQAAAQPPPRPPPKITDPRQVPVPPPRRRKSQRFTPPPMPFERRPIEQKPELPKKQFPLKFGSLKRFMPSGLAARPPTVPSKESQLRPSSGPYPHPDYPGYGGGHSDFSRFQHGNLQGDEDFALGRPSSGSHFGPHRNDSFRSDGSHSMRRNGDGFRNSDERSNAAELSSSDGDEEVRSGHDSCGGSFRGSSASRGGGAYLGRHEDQWPPYGGMKPHPANAIDSHRPMYNPNFSTLTRRNTMMSGTLGRASPFVMGRMGPGYMQMSNSVCDLTHPMMAGYPLPQVQSMADLQCGNMEGMPMMASAPCGCRPNWIGPDSFGMWLPPVRCMMHSSTASLYMMPPPHQEQQHSAGLMEGMVNHQPMYPPYAKSPKPPLNVSDSVERRASPAPSARSSGEGSHRRRLLKDGHNGTGTLTPASTSREGGNRKLRSRIAATVRPKATAAAAVDSSSSDQGERGDLEDDYFSAGTSEDDHDDNVEEVEDNDHRNRPAADETSSWECEHCTFINPHGSRICSVCCKTAAAALCGDKKPLAVTVKPSKTVQDKRLTRVEPLPLPPPSLSFMTKVEGGGGKSVAADNVKRSKPIATATAKDDGVYEDLAVVKSASTVANVAADNGAVKVLSHALNCGLNVDVTKDPGQNLSAKAKWMAMDAATATSAGFPAAAASSVPDTSKQAKESLSVPAEVVKDESVDTIATQSEAKMDISMAAASLTKNSAMASRNVTSTGTSPPPQSISTQTPIEPPWSVDMASTSASGGLLERTSSRLSLSGIGVNTGNFNDAPYCGPLPPSSSMLKRTTSLHFPHSGGCGSSGSAFGYGDQSHTGYMYRNGSRTSLMSDHPFGYSSGPPSRDVSPPPRSGYLSRRDSDRAYPGYSRFGHVEDRGLLPRVGSRKDYYLSLEELVERRRHETMRTQGLELVRLLREAEQYSFTADDLQVALNHCGSSNPVQWLRDNWRNMVDTVATLSTNHGRDKKENDVGEVSTAEAKEALRIHKGNIWAAVTECVEQRQLKLAELNGRGNFTREEVLNAINANAGHVESAFDDLNKSNLKPFLMRIWGPPTGVDNDASSVDVGSRFGLQNQSAKTQAENIRNIIANEDNPYEKYSRTESGLDVVPSLGNPDAEKISAVAAVNASINTDEPIGQYEVEDENDEEGGDEDVDIEDERDENVDGNFVEDEDENVDEDFMNEDDLSEDDDDERLTDAASSKNDEFYDTVAGSPVIKDANTASDEPVRRTPVEPTFVTPECQSPSPAPSNEISQARSTPPSVRSRTSTPTKMTESIFTKQLAAKERDFLTSEFSRRVRQLLAEGKVDTYEKASVVVKLLALHFNESEAIYAANECSDVYMAVSYLQQDCELCAGKFPMAQMISMLFCVHRCCRNCARDYFTLKIKERTIMETVCPFCNEPDLTDDNIAADYFNNLDILLKNLLDHDVHELFQRKLRDRALMNDPNFHWCAKCASGFIAEPNQRRLVCPDCLAVSCALCKKAWERQHDGISCKQFAEWKEANDPEYQAVGLQKYLAENGIDCPKCKFKYALAKGGCMHFTCCQCKFEFCSGCGKPFRMGKKCSVSVYCEKLGLHAHHPRNCLFYLRDKEPKELQKLLDDNEITYDVDTSHTGDVRMKCPVVEQKELPNGNEDAVCGREVEAGHAGLCRLHYVEYLVSLVNNNRIDPLYIMDVGGLQQELRRAAKSVPEPTNDELDVDYQKRLIQIIMAEIPLSEA